MAKAKKQKMEKQKGAGGNEVGGPSNNCSRDAVCALVCHQKLCLASPLIWTSDASMAIWNWKAVVPECRIIGFHTKLKVMVPESRIIGLYANGMNINNICLNGLPVRFKFCSQNEHLKKKRSSHQLPLLMLLKLLLQYISHVWKEKWHLICIYFVISQYLQKVVCRTL